MTHAQALKLKALAEQAYRPEQFVTNLRGSRTPDRRARGGNRVGRFVLICRDSWADQNNARAAKDTPGAFRSHSTSALIE
jgi:hypothetical protein